MENKYSIYTYRSANNEINHYRTYPEYLTLAPTPNDEKCTQAGDYDHTEDSIVECHAYIEQLIRVHGEPPTGCAFFIMRNFHEAGEYYEAAMFYDPDNEEQYDYANLVEGGCEKWDDQARSFLVEAKHHLFVPQNPLKVATKEKESTLIVASINKTRKAK